MSNDLGAAPPRPLTDADLDEVLGRWDENSVPWLMARELKRARRLLGTIKLIDWPSEEELAASVVTFHMTLREVVEQNVRLAWQTLREAEAKLHVGPPPGMKPIKDEP